MKKMIKKITASILAITMVLSSNMIAFAATAPVECDIKQGRTLQDFVDEYNENNATSYTVSDATQITHDNDCDLVLFNPGENEEGCLWVCYNHGFEMTSSPSHESEYGARIFMHTPGTPCEYCGWGEDETGLPTLSDIKAALAGNIYASNDGTAVAIICDESKVEILIGTSSGENEYSDIEISAGETNGTYTLKINDDKVFYLTFEFENESITNISLSCPEYMGEGLETECELITSDNILNSEAFLSKFAKTYSTMWSEDEIEFYFAVDYSDEKFAVSMAGNFLYSLIAGNTVLKVDDNEYIIICTINGSNATLEFTIENDEVTKLTMMKHVLDKEGIIEDTKTVAEYTIGSTTLASLHCSLPLDYFVSVDVDGITLEENDQYILEEGSTVVKFKKDFLDSLSVGTHPVKLHYNMDGDDTTDDKVIETSIIVKSNAPTPTPEPTPTPTPSNPKPYKAPNTSVR